MKFKSPIISAASGSIGGAVYSHNRFGQYIRNRIVPVNPSSSAQVGVRNSFGNLAARWQTITSVQRASWTLYGANVPVTNVNGDSINLTGLNWYIGCNTLRLQVGLSILDQAPGIFDRASLTPPVPTLSAPTSSIAFTSTDTWAGAVGGALAVYQSFPKSKTINFYKGPYRFIGKVLGAASPPASPVSFTNTAPFVTPVRGFYKFVAINADGRFSPLVTAQSDL